MYVHHVDDSPGHLTKWTTKCSFAERNYWSLCPSVPRLCNSARANTQKQGMHIHVQENFVMRLHRGSIFRMCSHSGSRMFCTPPLPFFASFFSCTAFLSLPVQFLSLYPLRLALCGRHQYCTFLWETPSSFPSFLTHFLNQNLRYQYFSSLLHPGVPGPWS